MARANPVCAITASRLSWLLVSVASVATTASVVLSRALALVRGASASAGTRAGNPVPPNSPARSHGAAQNHGPSATTTLPAAFTAASAPTVWPRSVTADPEPNPPLRLTLIPPRPAPAATAGASKTIAVTPDAKAVSSASPTLSPATSVMRLRATSPPFEWDNGDDL